MKINRRITGLFAFALASLFAVSSCSKDDNNPAGDESNKESISIPVDLEAQFGAFDTNSVDTRSDKQLRALSSPTGQEVSTNIVVEDGSTYILTDERLGTSSNSKASASGVKSKWAHLDSTELIKQNLDAAGKGTLDMLLVLRIKGTSTYSYNYLKWTFDRVVKTSGSKPTIRYRVVNATVTLPTGATINSQIEGRVLFGGYYDKTTNRMRVPAGLFTEVTLDDSGKAKTKLPIPFSSSWSTMTATTGRLQFVYNPYSGTESNFFNLKPLGALITTTLRNNSDKDVTIEGIDIQSNALNMGEVEINPETGELYYNDVLTTFSNITTLSEGQEPTATQVGSYTMRDTKDTFYRMQMNGSSAISLPKNGTSDQYKVANKVFVLWAMPVSGKTTGNSQRYASMTGDAALKELSYAQTQIYARGVKSGGEAVTKPNYSVVPIFGTDYAFASGSSYTFNAELFTQPNVLLGYFAKYPVNAQGTGFVTSHKREDTDMVKYTVARQFTGEGKDLPVPSNSSDPTAPTGTAKYFLPPTPQLALLGLNYGPAIRGQRGGGWKEFSSTVSQAWLSDTRYELHTIEHNANGEIDFGPIDIEQNTYNRGRIYAHNISDKDRAYAITNKARSYGVWMNRNEQKDQTLWRYELKPNTTYYSGEDIDVRALFVGKYFVGNQYSPLYKGASILSETNFWQNSEATTNQVERYIVGRGVWNDGISVDTVNEFMNKVWKGPGHTGLVLWSISNGYGTARTMYWWAKGLYKDLAGSTTEGSTLAKKLAERNPYVGSDGKTSSATGTTLNENAISDGEGRYWFKDENNIPYFVFRWRDYPANSGWNGSPGSLGAFTQDSREARMFLPLLPVSKTYQGDSKD